ncbi:MAG TPA: hypothetical protein VEX35_01615 [Allosphingosinicella sp.]|nr:hypothetical protein [Allosphingosinicella sp.]
MKRLATALAVTGLLALGACNRTPAENNAAAVRDAAENKAEGFENKAEEARDSGENRAEGYENRADTTREAAENQADTIEANDAHD